MTENKRKRSISDYEELCHEKYYSNTKIIIWI